MPDPCALCSDGQAPAGWPLCWRCRKAFIRACRVARTVRRLLVANAADAAALDAERVALETELHHLDRALAGALAKGPQR